MSIPRFLATSALALAACKDDPNADLCHHYAKLATDCREDRSDEAVIVEETAFNFCIKGMNPKNDHIFGAQYRAKIECTRSVKAKDCAAYRACEGDLPE